MNYDQNYFLVDIDGTLTDYREGATAPEKLLHGNFLFPIICDLMVEQGWERERAKDAICDLAGRIVFWDYSHFIAAFELPVMETFRRLKHWHRDNLTVYDDAVQLVKELSGQDKVLLVMSNNPYLGCLFKLQVAGLAGDDFCSPYFRRIFGTNILLGCKNSVAVWSRALAQIPVDVSEIGVIGDNPQEDGVIPRSCGIVHSYILPRQKIAPGANIIGSEEKLD